MEESDKLSKLRPNGVLKVVHVPFSERDHYAFELRPGNSVWGKSWIQKPFDPEKKKKENNSPLEEQSELKEEDKRKEKDMNVVDRFSKYTSHVIIGLGLLVMLIMFARNMRVSQ